MFGVVLAWMEKVMVSIVVSVLIHVGGEDEGMVYATDLLFMPRAPVRLSIRVKHGLGDQASHVLRFVTVYSTFYKWVGMYSHNLRSSVYQFRLTMGSRMIFLDRM